MRDLVAPGERVAFIAAFPCPDERDPDVVERKGMRTQHGNGHVSRHGLGRLLVDHCIEWPPGSVRAHERRAVIAEHTRAAVLDQLVCGHIDMSLREGVCPQSNFTQTTTTRAITSIDPSDTAKGPWRVREATCRPIYDRPGGTAGKITDQPTGSHIPYQSPYATQPLIG